VTAAPAFLAPALIFVSELCIGTQVARLKGKVAILKVIPRFAKMRRYTDISFFRME
jgi:hypothetical protein